MNSKAIQAAIVVAVGLFIFTLSIAQKVEWPHAVYGGAMTGFIAGMLVYGGMKK